jgi:hypothetical protein
MALRVAGSFGEQAVLATPKSRSSASRASSFALINPSNNAPIGNPQNIVVTMVALNRSEANSEVTAIRQGIAPPKRSILS